MQKYHEIIKTIIGVLVGLIASAVMGICMGVIFAIFITSISNDKDKNKITLAECNSLLELKSTDKIENY